MDRKTELLYDAMLKYSDEEEKMRIKASEQYKIIENAKKALGYFNDKEVTARRKKKSVAVKLQKIGKL